MKNILRSFLGGFAAVVLAVVAQAADLAPGAFSAGTVKGDVTYKLAGTTQYLALTAGTAIPQGATIKTGAGSIAVVVFASGSTASIRPNSEVEISKFEQETFAGPLPTNAEPSLSNTQIRIINGEVVSKVAKLKKGSEFVVTSPVGAAGVRGTTFTVFYNASTGAYFVKTSEGRVIFRKNADGTTIDITAGNGFNGSAIAPLTAREIEAIDDAVAAFEIDNPDATGNEKITVTVPEIDTSIPVSTN